MDEYPKLTAAEAIDEYHAMKRRGRPWPQCRTCDGTGRIGGGAAFAACCSDCKGTGRRDDKRGL